MLWVDLGDVHNLLLNKKSGYQMVYAEWFFSLIKITCPYRKILEVDMPKYE